MPKLVIFWLMDALTTRECRAPGGAADAELAGLRCPAARGAPSSGNPCTDAGGTCAITQDGFYILAYAAVAVGFLSTHIYARVFPRLEALPLTAWRSKSRTA
jgi:Acetyl-coenzyme A transporter 1